MGDHRARLTLLVIYSERMDECRAFYSTLGLQFKREQHDQGPEHYATVLYDNCVFEIYPAMDHATETVRLGISVDGESVDPPLDAGRYTFRDPDDRKVDVQAV